MKEKSEWGKQTLMLNDKEVELLNTRTTSLGVVDTISEWVSPEPYELSFDIPHANVEPVFKSVLQMRNRLFSKKVAKDLKTKYCKQIIALQNGKEIHRFNSVLEAGNFINKPHADSNISACALGKRRSAYGYQWQYV